MNRLYARMDELRPLIEETLGSVLPRVSLPPETLHEAMRYSVLGGGKRLRPLLCIFSCQMCGGTEKDAFHAAAAVELLHAYSLIHDDLPAMDNDSMRRGKLTCHKAFGEAMAILAGDALLTLSFDVLASRYSPLIAGPACGALARAGGHAGMVGGQVMDLEGEAKNKTLEDAETIDRRKTGALIAVSCALGCIVAGGTQKMQIALEKYGYQLGLAFQITDDLLDLSGDPDVVGKATGKDSAAGKQTYPSILGEEKARELSKKLVADAKSSLAEYGKEALMLRLLADYVLERNK